MVTAIRSGAPMDKERRPRRSREERKKRAANRRPKASINTLVFNPFFILLTGLLVISCTISFFLVFSHPEGAWAQNQQTNEEGKHPPPKPKVGHNPYKDHRHLDGKQQLDALHGIGRGKQKVMTHAEKEEEDESGSGSGDRGSGEPESGDRGSGDADADSGSGDARKIAVKKLRDEFKKDSFAAFQPDLAPVYKDVTPFDTTLETPHLIPKLPYLPIFAEIENGDKLIDDLLHHNKPTIAGIVAFLNKYLKQLHEQNKKISEKEHRDATGQKINEMYFVESYFNLTSKVIDPFEDAYRGRTIFPIRDDESIFVSLAAFREHLLGKSMMSAFDNAKDPSKLFIGAVVQNCYGLDGVVCKTGLEVIGKDKNGRDMTSVSPKPPDANGIEEFCTHEKYKKYCESGQVRVIYLHDTDALGPQTARYYASKLWGGETYIMQMDAHLEFAPNWEQYYIDEAKASLNYPKTVLSAYPPGFKEYDGAFKGGGRGERLCGAHFSDSPVEHHILRIEQRGQTPFDAPRPTQIPFIAAGFFFAHSSWLQDVPFDPYAPWCFMGEEIALSIRSWTHGWNIYAPRKNVIAHQYRPGRLGLPKFWESVGRDSGRASLNTRLQKHVIRRVKHMLAYPTDSREIIKRESDEIVLHNFENYSMGHERSLEDYLQWTHINPTKQTTQKMDWCLKSTME